MDLIIISTNIMKMGLNYPSPKVLFLICKILADLTGDVCNKMDGVLFLDGDRVLTLHTQNWALVLWMACNYVNIPRFVVISDKTNLYMLTNNNKFESYNSEIQGLIDLRNYT